MRGALIRFISACVFISAIITLNLLNGFSYIPIEAQQNTIINREETGETSGISIIEQVENQQPKQQTQPSKNEKKATTVSSKENVKGKILSQHISPYKSAAGYQKIYLKNLTGQGLSIKELYEGKIGFKIEQNEEPQVLIVHTHTTETFMLKDSEYYTEGFSSRSRNPEYNMVKLGSIIANQLNSAGIKTLHSKKEHDYPEYTGSYTRSAATVRWYLAKYPSIKVVIDLHRDAVSSGKSDKVKLIADINGKRAAQVMLVMGSNTGNVTNFPKWKENLKLALRLQNRLETDYPTLARPLYLVSRNYNGSLSTGAMLIEIGTDVNTIDEVCLSAEYVGKSLVKVLKELK